MSPRESEKIFSNFVKRNEELLCNSDKEEVPRYARSDMSPLETRYFFAMQKSDIFAYGKSDMFT